MSSLSLSPTFTKSSKATIQISLPSQSYVLSLASLPSYIAASASVPSNAIHLLDKADLKSVVQTLPGHINGTTCMRAVKNFCDKQDVLISCGKDGRVIAWDERAGGIGVKMGTSGAARALLSCDVATDGWLVAAGTELKGEDASILYWDPRNPVAPLRTHASTHSDDITSIHFSQNQYTGQSILLSASSDGLVSISNPSEDDEDEAVLSVGNWGCSVGKAGWVNKSEGLVWAASDMETLSIWNSELDCIHDVDRDHLKYPHTELTWVTDYVIDCHTTTDGAFRMLAGSNEGDFALLTASQPFTSAGPWSLERTFSSQHSGIVRCALWDDASGVILSGGEDSVINAWSCPYSSDIPATESMDIDLPPRKRNYVEGESDELKRTRRI